MKVYDYNLTGASTAGTSRTPESAEAGHTSGSSAYGPRGDGDRIELSSTLHDVARALAEYGEDRAVEVESLAARYQSGRYYTDFAATSCALVGESFEK